VSDHRSGLEINSPQEPELKNTACDLFSFYGFEMSAVVLQLKVLQVILAIVLS